VGEPAGVIRVDHPGRGDDGPFLVHDDRRDIAETHTEDEKMLEVVAITYDGAHAAERQLAPPTEGG
jgi:hypothetical protein